MAAERAPRLVLASASPARRATLVSAGLDPHVVVSDVDEDAYAAAGVAELVAVLARAKAEAVAAGLEPDDDTLVVGCDSLLEIDGEPLGKPGTAEAAVAYWRRLRGGTGHLHTGHHVVRLGPRAGTAAGVETTTVHFADLDEEEIEAYVATGEPQQVAGGFTIDGLGGAYVRSVDGDPHAVVGISLPLLRDLFARLGVRWHTLWPPIPAVRDGGDGR